MKITVIMVDGSFRENVYAAKYFSQQDFPSDQFEVIWVEYFDGVNPNVLGMPRVRSICLGKSGEYHSSFCFNKGIDEAKGELLVIPDADVIVKPTFLTELWDIHQKFDQLACYIRRYDEFEDRRLDNLSFVELDSKCLMKNPSNYGGCLTIKKKWLMHINGYEMHPIFSTGFHANGLDIYVRLKNLGLSVMWAPSLKLYHPWHPFTREYVPAYDLQREFIRKRELNLEYMAHFGIREEMNVSNCTYEVSREQYENNMRELTSTRHKNKKRIKIYKKVKKVTKRVFGKA